MLILQSSVGATEFLFSNLNTQIYKDKNTKVRRRKQYDVMKTHKYWLDSTKYWLDSTILCFRAFIPVVSWLFLRTFVFSHVEITEKNVMALTEHLPITLLKLSESYLGVTHSWLVISSKSCCHLHLSRPTSSGKIRKVKTTKQKQIRRICMANVCTKDFKTLKDSEKLSFFILSLLAYLTG